MAQVNAMLEMSVPVFTHQFPFRLDLFIKTNFLVIVFNITFFLAYVAIKQRVKTKPVKIELSELKSPKGVLFILLFLSLVSVILNVDFILNEFARPSWQSIDMSPGAFLVRIKILFYFPLAGVIYCVYILKKQSFSTQSYLLVVMMLAIFLILLFLLKNPFLVKRNALGPIYLLLVFLFIPRLVNSNVKTSILLFTAMIVGFPTIQYFTHIDYGFAEFLQDPSLLFQRKYSSADGYMSLNYDAFINIAVVLDHVEQEGLYYGFQMLSGLLFFIPRSIWPSKPEASGKMVGNHLIDNYDYWFQNLSNPFISEGYLNFGWLGIVLFAILLAYFIVKFLTWLNSENYFKKAISFYFAMHLIFFLRGDFTNGFSYFVGVFFAIYVIPKIIIKLYNTICFGTYKLARENSK
jgi:hypothetical protein